ncbi:MAG: hypothetical protein RJQ01_05360 [Microcella sp.]|uniref:hypothetical protein n=1 Tax=Microcella sp. TaxID=1913979 RepID=UPI003314E086
MILRLDPALPIVWRSPFSLQIGVDPVAVVLEEVDDGDARVVAALAAGASRAALARSAAAAGVRPARVDELLERLEPALVSGTRTVPESGVALPECVAVRGSVDGRRGLARVLTEAGCTVVDSSARASAPAVDAAVLVSHHVADPVEHLTWLRRDIPHLPVVFGERAVTIGPLVVPGESPCLACLEQQRADVDPAWPAIGSQLWGRRAAAESGLTATLAALEALTLLRRLAAGRGGSGMSIRLDVIDDVRTVTQWAASARCGCRGLELSAPASGNR